MNKAPGLRARKSAMFPFSTPPILKNIPNPTPSLWALGETFWKLHPSFWCLTTERERGESRRVKGCWSGWRVEGRGGCTFYPPSAVLKGKKRCEYASMWLCRPRSCEINYTKLHLETAKDWNVSFWSKLPTGIISKTSSPSKSQEEWRWIDFAFDAKNFHEWWKLGPFESNTW